MSSIAPQSTPASKTPAPAAAPATPATPGDQWGAAHITASTPFVGIAPMNTPTAHTAPRQGGELGPHRTPGHPPTAFHTPLAGRPLGVALLPTPTRQPFFGGSGGALHGDAATMEDAHSALAIGGAGGGAAGGVREASPRASPALTAASSPSPAFQDNTGTVHFLLPGGGLPPILGGGSVGSLSRASTGSGRGGSSSRGPSSTPLMGSLIGGGIPYYHPQLGDAPIAGGLFPFGGGPHTPQLPPPQYLAPQVTRAGLVSPPPPTHRPHTPPGVHSCDGPPPSTPPRTGLASLRASGGSLTSDAAASGFSPGRPHPQTPVLDDTEISHETHQAAPREGGGALTAMTPPARRARTPASPLTGEGGSPDFSGGVPAYTAPGSTSSCSPGIATPQFLEGLLYANSPTHASRLKGVGGGPRGMTRQPEFRQVSTPVRGAIWSNSPQPATGSAGDPAPWRGAQAPLLQGAPDSHIIAPAASSAWSSFQGSAPGASATAPLPGTSQGGAFSAVQPPPSLPQAAPMATPPTQHLTHPGALQGYATSQGVHCGGGLPGGALPGGALASHLHSFFAQLPYRGPPLTPQQVAGAPPAQAVYMVQVQQQQLHALQQLQLQLNMLAQQVQHAAGPSSPDASMVSSARQQAAGMLGSTMQCLQVLQGTLQQPLPPSQHAPPHPTGPLAPKPAPGGAAPHAVISPMALRVVGGDIVSPLPHMARRGQLQQWAEGSIPAGRLPLLAWFLHALVMHAPLPWAPWRALVGGVHLAAETPTPKHLWHDVRPVLPSGASSGNAPPPQIVPAAAAHGSKPATRRAADTLRALDAAGLTPRAILTQVSRDILPELPPSAHQRVLIDSADIAKRRFDGQLARAVYRRATRDNPWASAAWLERAKQEEEDGETHAALCVLRSALVFCPESDALLSKGVRLWEQGGSLQEARRTLGGVMLYAPPPDAWPAVLQLANLEARAGHVDTAEQILRVFLHDTWQRSQWDTGMGHIQAAQVMTAAGRHEVACELLAEGMRACPKHTPLWQALLAAEAARMLAATHAAWGGEGDTPPDLLNLAHAMHASTPPAQLAGVATGAAPPPVQLVVFARNTRLVPDMTRMRVGPGGAVWEGSEVAWKLHHAIAAAEDASALLTAQLAARAQAAAEGGAGGLAVACAWRTVAAACWERCSDCIGAARSALGRALQCAAPASRWRVWCLGARLEATLLPTAQGSGGGDRAEHILRRSGALISAKYQRGILLELAKVHEYRALTEQHLEQKAKHGSAAAQWNRTVVEGTRNTDWKMHMHAAYHAIRSGDMPHALLLLQWSLRHSPVAGRLQALRLQCLAGSVQAAKPEHTPEHALAEALSHVPKGGEVWLEAARLHLNPVRGAYSTARAAQCLALATLFTPQYGDCFIEWLRLDVLRWCGLGTEAGTGAAAVVAATQLVEGGVEPARTPLTGPPVLGSSHAEWLQHALGTPLDRVSHWATWLSPSQPNYGLLWSHFRHHPADPPAAILQRALPSICAGIATHRHLYAAAAAAACLTPAASGKAAPPLLLLATELALMTHLPREAVKPPPGHACTPPLEQVLALGTSLGATPPQDKVWAKDGPTCLAPPQMQAAVDGLAAVHIRHSARLGALSPAPWGGVAALGAALRGGGDASTTAADFAFACPHFSQVWRRGLPTSLPRPEARRWVWEMEGGGL